MPLEGVLLGEVVVEVLAHVLVRVLLVLDVLATRVQVLLLLLQLDVHRAKLAAQVDVPGFGSLDVLAEVVAVGGDAVDVLSEGDDLDGLLGVEVFDSGDLSLVVVELSLFGLDVVAPRVDRSLCLLNFRQSLFQVKFECSGLVLLINAFSSLQILDLPKPLNLSKHVGPL